MCPPALNSPLRPSHTNHTIICDLDSENEEENKKEREGRGEEGGRKGAFINADVTTAPHHYCGFHRLYDFKSCSNILVVGLLFC